MAGGNDSHNWVVPVDPESYSTYAQARSALAMPLSGLSALSGSAQQAAGRQFAFANDISPMRELYEQRKLAVVANVGPLVAPTTKRQFEMGWGLPAKLFSHNDQQSAWQALAPEGARSGWGGRLADILMSANDAPIFTAVSAAGNAIFLSGLHATQYQIQASGAVGINALQNPSTFGATNLRGVLQRTLVDPGGSAFQSDYARVVKRSSEAYNLLAQAASHVNVASITNDPRRLSNGATFNLQQCPLGRQLQAVARMMGTHQQLGLRRQVFLVSMGGFDTHAHALRDQPNLMAGVSQSIAYFLSALRGLGLENNVTLFTASDFGRTLTSNGAGSDHGWGSHHFVAGGAVNGGDIYGHFPNLSLGGPDDVGSGRLLPSTSVTAYGATLARWMGVSSTNLPSVFSNLGNFDNTALGFV